MVWFKVDDGFYSHPKVLSIEPGALGLWVVAGSWSAAHLTEGVVPDHVLPRLLDGAAELAPALVAAGLWTRIRNGYKFHDWLDQNPSKEDVNRERTATAERQKRWREAQRNGVSNAVTDTVTRRVTNGVSNAAPTRPIRDGSTKKGGSSPNTRDTNPPPPTQNEPLDGRCAAHRHTINPPPCGPCADARRRAQTADDEHTKADKTEQVARHHHEATTRQQAINNCHLCNTEGRTKTGALCHHDPAALERAKRGVEKTRAILKEIQTQ